MNEAKKASFHHLYGERKERIFYKDKDFLDYEIMSLITGVVLIFSYGLSHPFTLAGLLFCAWMMVAFPMRNGLALSVPLILKQPQDILYMFVYKIKNLHFEYYLAVALLAGQHYLVQLTPEWPHYIDITRTLALALFYLHFAGISIYRTVILVDHLRKKARVHEVLMQTPWKRVLKRPGSTTYEIWHAYFTGLLTHLVLIAPWFLVIRFVDFSAVLTPIMLVANVLILKKALTNFNAWYYRDHWLGHNSELEFVYMHGPHHDAIPSGLIGVSGNGFLEGFLRHSIGGPMQFFNPLLSFVFYNLNVKSDIDSHQYIPGIFPMLEKDYHRVHQHSMHHLGKMRPLGFGINLSQDNVPEHIGKMFKGMPENLINSAQLDTELSGFEWDNKRFRWFLDLVDKYEKIDAADKEVKTAK